MRSFYILSIILLTITFSSQAQSRINIPIDPVVKLLFYPNPASSQITFSFEKGYEKNYSFQIFNFIGKKVYETNTVLPKTTIGLADFYRGLYIFQVRNPAGKILESGKFQVTK